MNTASCPICGRALPADGPAGPFCGDRCRLIDLGRWLGETYRIPDADDTEDEETAREDEDVP